MTRSPFRWTTTWNGIILSDDNLILPNTWTIKFDYNAVDDDMYRRDIAMQRLEFMFEEKFETSIWTNFSNSWVEILYEKMNAFIITLPSEPYDSLIASTALLKAQSITNGVFDFQGCSITSNLGYRVENIIEMEEAVELSESTYNQQFSDGPWYMRPDAGFTDILTTQDDVVTLIKDSNDWSQHDLNWDYYNNDDNVDSLEKYKHNNQKERWIPLVIKGGANKDED